MQNRVKFLFVVICFALSLFCIYKIIDYYTPTIADKQLQLSSLQNELRLSDMDYSNMISDIEIQKEELQKVVDEDRDNLRNLEKDLKFYKKEDVFLDITKALSENNCELTNFYVVSETNAKIDYSVEIYGNIYDINRFVEDLYLKIEGISAGEFSIRQKDDADYLVRFFDKSDALKWYDGSIYDEDNEKFLTDFDKSRVEEIKSELFETDESDKLFEELNNLEHKIPLELPNEEDILYVLTFTFRV